ncbi:MAG: hypothetical protein RL685_5139 [Pseudomonadota bacterium]
MGDADPIWQEVGDVALLEESLRKDDEVLAWVDPVSDAGGQDGQDVGDPFAAGILPREQPVSTAENELSEFAFAPIVGQGNVAILEEQDQSRALPVKIAERATECGFRRNDGALFVDPGEDGRHEGLTLVLSPRLSLRGVVAGVF